MSANEFLHGIEFVQIDTLPRAITNPRSGVVGIVGTAPNADPDVFPLNKPVLVPGDDKMLANLGAGGTLPWSMRALYSTASRFFVVVVRVEAGADDAEALSNYVGGVDESGQYTGIAALRASETEAKVKPRILIAPGMSHLKPVAAALVAVADSLRAIIHIDAPNGENDRYQDAISYQQEFSNRRINVNFPSTILWDTVSNAYEERPASVVAALIEAGTNYYDSSSNTATPIVSGLSRTISYEPEDRNTIANLLNENNVTTFIHKGGFRLFGNRGCSDDPVWAFRAHVRLDDMIAESVMQAHWWAVDRRITRNYTDTVTAGINNYLRHLANPTIGAIAGGRSWLDLELNTPDQMQAGKVFFDFDYGRFGIAEHVGFRRFLNNGYVEEVFAQ